MGKTFVRSHLRKGKAVRSHDRTIHNKKNVDRSASHPHNTRLLDLADLASQLPQYQKAPDYQIDMREVERAESKALEKVGESIKKSVLAAAATTATFFAGSILASALGATVIATTLAAAVVLPALAISGFVTSPLLVRRNKKRKILKDRRKKNKTKQRCHRSFETKTPLGCQRNAIIPTNFRHPRQSKKQTIQVFD